MKRFAGPSIVDEDFSGRYLSASDYDGRELVRVNLSGADLSGARLNDSVLRECDLAGTYLREASLAGAVLEDCRLVGADLTGAVLRRTRLRGVDLTDAMLCGASLQDSEFSEAVLDGVTLSGAQCTKADFTSASLIGAQFGALRIAGSHGEAAEEYDGAVLRHANFSGADLQQARMSRVRGFQANMPGADFTGADLEHADLSFGDLRGSVFTDALLKDADLSWADASGGEFGGASLSSARLVGTNLTNARLTDADLRYAQLVGTNLTGATLERCQVYASAAWDVQVSDTVQRDLRIAEDDKSVGVSVDNLEVAQFIYLISNNRTLSGVIDTITSKAVLILGRFRPDRKRVLEAIRERLRDAGYLPIIFDFEKPKTRDLTETITLLARLAKFVVADLTEPSSIPQELQAIIPDVAVPIVPVIERDVPWAMFADQRKYHWVLDVHPYSSVDELVADLPVAVIERAEAKVAQLRP